jgi:hypothetical protein
MFEVGRGVDECVGVDKRCQGPEEYQNKIKEHMSVFPKA